ncbi:MAG TPA: DUF916 domain-containing protein [Candidatus Angelobacter sp.]|jgi:hypothetical protein|nr:DUF916 domain-containing protein [Candidatus Angelobacter sp.]
MRSTASRIGALAAALSAAVALAAGGTGATAAGPGGISLSPAHADPANPATRAYFIRSVQPGHGFSDAVVVTNQGDSSADLIVSAVDGLTGATSGAVYANRQDPVSRAGAWIKPQSGTVTVGAHATIQVPFTVSVPAGTTPGDHLGGIAVEGAHPTTSGQGVAVTTVLRSVVGVLVQVPGPAAAHFHVDAAVVQPLPGTRLASLVVTLGDDGQLLGKPTLAVTLSGPGGYHNTVTRKLDTVLPGDTIAFPFPWPDALAPGSYEVGVALSADGAPPVQFHTTAANGAPLAGGATPTPAPPAAPVQPAAPTAVVTAGGAGGLPMWVIPLTAVAALSLGLSTRWLGRRSR